MPKIDPIDIATNANEAAKAFERLTAAIKASSEALAALSVDHGGVVINVAGEVATLEIKPPNSYKAAGAIGPEDVMGMIQRADVGKL